MRNPFKRDRSGSANYIDIVRSVRTRERKHLRRWWQWLLLGLFVLLIAVGSFGVWRYYRLQSQLREDAPDEAVVTPEKEGEPFNALLVGSDSREGLSEEEQLDLGANAVEGPPRADTLILAHVDPASDHIVMVQFPRDLFVPILDEGQDRINSALEDGTTHLVRAVEHLTRVEINKYVQVNIAGFREVIDAIGGVEICIPEPIPFDPRTGNVIRPDEVGMVQFDGDRALRFVRSRAFEHGDFDRIRNQQRFLSAALRKVLSTETLLRPDRVLRVVDAAGENLTTDVHTTPAGLRRFLEQFRSFDPQRYEAYTAPNFGPGESTAGASIVIPDMPALRLMFEAIDNNESPASYDGVPEIDPTEIRVAIYNGTGDDGVAAGAKPRLQEATATLSEGGVRVVHIGDARRSDFRTSVIRYEGQAAEEADFVAAAVPGAKLEEVDQTRRGVDVELVVGRRFRARRVIQLRPLEIPPPGEVPEECRR